MEGPVFWNDEVHKVPNIGIDNGYVRSTGDDNNDNDDVLARGSRFGGGHLLRYAAERAGGKRRLHRRVRGAQVTGQDANKESKIKGVARWLLPS